MGYLLAEIVIGLLVAMLAGFWFGWILRGVRDRIRRSRTKRPGDWRGT